MKNYCILAVVFLLSCHHTKQVITHKEAPFVLTRNYNLPKYRVTKIDSVKAVYVIYAQKDSLLYKIVSGKADTIDCKNIKVNGEYGFMIHSLFPTVVFGKDTLAGRPDLVNAVEFNGSSIMLEKGCVDDIFVADNVAGLCIKYQ